MGYVYCSLDAYGENQSKENAEKFGAKSNTSQAP